MFYFIFLTLNGPAITLCRIGTAQCAKCIILYGNNEKNNFFCCMYLANTYKNKNILYPRFTLLVWQITHKRELKKKC